MQFIRYISSACTNFYLISILTSHSFTLFFGVLCVQLTLSHLNVYANMHAYIVHTSKNLLVYICCYSMSAGVFTLHLIRLLIRMQFASSFIFKIKNMLTHTQTRERAIERPRIHIIFSLQLYSIFM